GRPEDVTADENEIGYLLKVVNRYFNDAPGRADVPSTFSGVRPLYDDNAENPSAVTRDYVFELDAGDGNAPLLSVFGGKITTFRKLSEHALQNLKPFFPGMTSDWTAHARLPGGDIADADFDAFLAGLVSRYPWLGRKLAQHYGRLYGTRAHALIANARGLGDLGRQFGPLFFEREAMFLMQAEWAMTPQDIIERRTKHGLSMSESERRAFEIWFSGVTARAG
nr:glycerol-3-phosphate dehydrogenase C-terminal domain-containing protein [Rhizobiaceae bacterium]